MNHGLFEHFSQALVRCSHVLLVQIMNHGLFEHFSQALVDVHMYSWYKS